MAASSIMRAIVSFAWRGADASRALQRDNGELKLWLDTVANVRLHGTTNRIVSEAFLAERPELQALPAARFDALIKLERRVSHDGVVAIGGNYYSVHLQGEATNHL